MRAGVARNAVAIGQHLQLPLSTAQLEEMQAELSVSCERPQTPEAAREREELLLTPPERLLAPLKRPAEAQRPAEPRPLETPRSFQERPPSHDSLPSLPQKRRRDILERALEFPKPQTRSNQLLTAPRGSLFGSISGEFKSQKARGLSPLGLTPCTLRLLRMEQGVWCLADARPGI